MSVRSIRAALAIAPLVAVLAAAPAPAATRAQVVNDAPTWATVNACGPGQLGVRASLSGTGHGRMSARMSAQWLDPASDTWKPVAGSSASPWLDAGSADVHWTQVGWTFHISPPPAGQGYRLRGVAELRWTSGRSTTLITRGGVMTTAGTSLATCGVGNAPSGDWTAAG